MYNVRTKIKMVDRDFVIDFTNDVKSGMKVVDLLEKHGITYHVYRNLMFEYFGIEISPCRRGSK